jgi:hypothetical protein
VIANNAIKGTKTKVFTRLGNSLAREQRPFDAPHSGDNGDAKRLVLLFVFLVITQTSLAPSLAQTPSVQSQPDRVRLAPGIESKSPSKQRWYPRPVTTQIGKVVQLDANQLSIILAGQVTPTRFASERVLGIELSTIPEDQAAAIESFNQGNFTAALPGLIRSISERDRSDRPPVWRQQWLSMLAAQAAMRSGRGDVALELVAKLDARPLSAMILGILPIDWTGTLVTDNDMFDSAVRRAKSDSLAVKLVAASWLLRSPTYRSAAESAIRRLAAQQDRKRISSLAAQLVWRTKTPPELQAQLAQWEDQIDELPMALQTGPMVSLRHHAQRAGIKDAARKWELAIELAAPTWHPDQ